MHAGILLGTDLSRNVDHGAIAKATVIMEFRTAEVERIIDFSAAPDLILANTYVKKKDKHRTTFASGRARLQVDS